MARNLDSELARLSRIARRRVRHWEARKIAADNLMKPSGAERVVLIWNRIRARLTRWLRR